MARTQLFRWCALVCMTVGLVGVVPDGAAAQELYGSVVGTVQDNSGGVIPGASI